jgi:hypothetical protein
MAAVETHESFVLHPHAGETAYDILPDTRSWFNPGRYLPTTSLLTLMASTLEYMGLHTTTRYMMIAVATVLALWMVQRLLNRRKKTNAWW